MMAVTMQRFGTVDTMEDDQSSQSCSTISSNQDTWSSFNFDWLFDPDRIDHLPIEEQLERYSKRDLKKTKVYKVAAKIWGAPLSRKRLIIAPPMYPDQRASCGDNIEVTGVTADLQPSVRIDPGPSKQFIQQQIEKDRVTKYKKWMDDRKAFRHNLDSMGLDDGYLSRKPDKTALEMRVLTRMLDTKYPKRPPSPPRAETPCVAVIADEIPLIQRPSPMAIKIIEKFLHENKLRLIDLFRSVDKDKDWKVSRDEFRSAIQKARIPISEVLLEDLILALDSDLNNELDYRELAKGMGLWKIEKRETKRKQLHSTSFAASPSKFSQLSGFESPEYERLDLTKSRPSAGVGSLPSSGKGDRTGATQSRDTHERSQSRIKSALSTISSTSSTRYLEPPPPDTRAETRVADSEEAMLDLRKRDRDALSRLTGKKGPEDTQKPIKKRETSNMSAKNVLKTGDRAIDNHLMSSTLTGETAEQVNKFRQLRFKEYTEICRMCKERSVPLSEALLKKVLLYPPEKLHKDIKKKIRQPAMPLFSEHFAVPPKEPTKIAKSPSEEEELAKKATKVKVAKDGKIEVYVDSRRAYPKRATVAAVPQKVMLSSGKAVIRRQVDCWLSFEEYEKLTRHLATRYVNIYGHTDDNAFWPGHLLDKLQLYMPETEPHDSSLFHSTRQQKRTNHGMNNDLLTWPINERGYVQYGTIS